LRYLPQGQLRLVYHALRERERLRHFTAPHLVRPLKFLFPFYRGRHPSRTAVCAGLILYDLFARTPSAERHQRLDRNQVGQFEPCLEPEGLVGGAIYVDAKGEDARITLENVLDAAYHGAAVANYVRVEGFARSGHQLAAFLACDTESGSRFETRGRVFVNAAGPWADEIRRLDDDGCRPLVRLTKGVHLVVESSHLPIRHSLVLADNAGRIIFLIRYDDYVLIGTTDTDFDGCGTVNVNSEDADYLLNIVNRSIPRARLRKEHIASCFAGLRTLPISKHLHPSSVTREELIGVGRSGLITIAGGKLTTHREIASRIVDRVMKMLGRHRGKSPTLMTPLPGARDTLRARASMGHLAPDAYQALMDRYGNRAELVIRLVEERPELAESLGTGSSAIAAEVIHAVRNEFARTIADFISRRTAMAWRAPAAVHTSAPQVARLMGQELGWSPDRQRRELESFVESNVDRAGLCRAKSSDNFN
jgi:glycerol-3-phosphate dehydrogenase